MNRATAHLSQWGNWESVDLIGSHGLADIRYRPAICGNAICGYATICEDAICAGDQTAGQSDIYMGFHSSFSVPQYVFLPSTPCI